MSDFISLIVIVFVVFLIINKFQKKIQKKCQMCENETNEFLISLNNGQEETKFLCREHLISEFKQSFEAYSYPMVICQPDDNWTSYCFYNLKDLLEFGDAGSLVKRFSKKSKESLIKMINDLQGEKCQECSSKAEVVYLSEKHWDENYEIDKIYLCKQHGFNKIKNALLNNPKSFSSGIYLPSNEAGLYISEWL